MLDAALLFVPECWLVLYFSDGDHFWSVYPIFLLLDAAAAAGEYVITSPLPGVIKEFFVKEGQQVKATDVVCILEAMKMGNEIHAGKDGVVKSINVAKDESVLEGTTIMIIA